MSKYGEPWHIDEDEHVMNSSDKDMGGPETWQRIVACVNALKGCPDPQAFVNAVRKMSDDKVSMKKNAKGWFYYGALDWLRIEKP